MACPANGDLSELSTREGLHSSVSFRPCHRSCRRNHFRLLTCLLPFMKSMTVALFISTLSLDRAQGHKDTR